MIQANMMVETFHNCGQSNHLAQENPARLDHLTSVAQLPYGGKKLLLRAGLGAPPACNSLPQPLELVLRKSHFHVYAI